MLYLLIVAKVFVDIDMLRVRTSNNALDFSSNQIKEYNVVSTLCKTPL